MQNLLSEISCAIIILSLSLYPLTPKVTHCIQPFIAFIQNIGHTILIFIQDQSQILTSPTKLYPSNLYYPLLLINVFCHVFFNQIKIISVLQGVLKIWQKTSMAVPAVYLKSDNPFDPFKQMCILSVTLFSSSRTHIFV